MKRWLLSGLSLVYLLGVLPAARGNAPLPIPIPKPNGPAIGPPPGGRPGFGLQVPAQEVKLVVQVDEKAKKTRLQVPLNLLFGQPLQPGLPGAPPRDLPPPPRRGADAGLLGTPTIVAGLALTLAFASGGLWLVRRGSGRYLAILLVLSLFAAGTAAVWADLAPRPRPRPLPPPPVQPALPAIKLPAGIELSGKLVLEMAPAGDHLTLIVPKAMVIKKEKADTPPK